MNEEGHVVFNLHLFADRDCTFCPTMITISHFHHAPSASHLSQPINRARSRAGSASRRVDLAVFIALTRNSAGSVDITVRLTDPLDPYFLYTLNLSDDDFSK